MTPTLLDAIDITEAVNLGFPFAAEIEVGETVVSVDLDVAVESGTDPTPRQSFVGMPQVMAVTYDVIQLFSGRVAPAVYIFRCQMVLSSGRKLTRFSRLPVQDYLQQGSLSA